MSQYVTGKREVHFERVPRSKVLSDLRDAAQILGEPLLVHRYRAEAPKRGWVADFTAAKRYGSWAAACQAAGVRCNRRLGRYSSRFGQRDCARALKACAKELGASPTFAGYSDWARDRPGHPKGETVRYHFASWNAALTASGLALNKRTRASR